VTPARGEGDPVAGPGIARTILFLYGTLKRGEKSHRLLAGQRFVGEATTEPRYRLYDLGPYPGLVADVAGVAVAGELWDVDAAGLAELDRFEGVPDLFVRELVAVRGTAGPVEAYLYARPVPSGARSGGSWPLG
jgi:gamma-glutamylaminecyclotransferase